MPANAGQLQAHHGEGARELRGRPSTLSLSCSVATTNLANRVSDPVQRALAEIAPGFSQAETGPIQPLGLRVISR